MLPVQNNYWLGNYGEIFNLIKPLNHHVYSGANNEYKYTQQIAIRSSRNSPRMPGIKPATWANVQ